MNEYFIFQNKRVRYAWSTGGYAIVIREEGGEGTARQQGYISGDLICHSEDVGLCPVGNELARKAFRYICWLHTLHTVL